MANNTDEYWDIDGVSLHQFGWSVVTVGGARYDMPPKRGSNITLAYRQGQVHRAKLLDQRTISLVMFLVGMDPGTGASTGNQRLRYNDSWDFLRRLVHHSYAINGGRVVLTRRWELTAPTFPDSSADPDQLVHGDPGVPAAGVRILAANAAVELSSDMAPTMTGRFRSDFQIDLTMADPFFYGAEVELTLDPGDTSLVWNDGHDIAHAQVEVDFIGPLTDPVLTNLSTAPETWVRYNGTIASGQTVRLKPSQFLAQQITAGNANRVGLLSHYGSPLWVQLLPGRNKLSLTATGAGSAVVRFRPPYA